jgi:PEP-CTERM motif
MKRIVVFVLLAFVPHYGSKGMGLEVDQSNLISTSGGFGSESVNSWNQLSQTFTVGRNGLLNEVDLQLVALGDTTQITTDLMFTLSRVSSLSTPVGVPLASASFSCADVPQLDQAGASSGYLLSIHLNAPPVVSQGDFLSVTLTSAQPWSSSGQYDWISTPSDNIDRYPSGAAWHNLNNTGWVKESYMVDFGFQTYVMPIPEPSILTLLAGGLSGLVARRRHRVKS